MNSKRITEIDGLRGISALSVMLFHYTYVYNPTWNLGKLFHFGYMGVPMFFIISGFVIYMSIERNRSYLDFIFNRFIRLYPVYWLCLIMTVIAMYLSNIHREQLSLLNIAANLTMIQRFFGFKDIDGAYWTLAIELMFYFLIVLLLLLKRMERIIEFFLGLICIIFLSRVILYNLYPEWKNLHLLLRQLRYFHLFLAGMVFYKIYKQGMTNKELAIIIVCLLFNFASQLRFTIYQETLIVLFFFLIFLILLSKYRWTLAFLNLAPLQFLGKISYPLYLLNEMFGISISQFLQIYFNLQLSVKIFLVCSIVILVSSLVHVFLEKPLFNLIKRMKNAS